MKSYSATIWEHSYCAKGESNLRISFNQKTESPLM